MDFEILVWAAATVVGYAAAANRLFAMVRPLRDKAVELAASLVQDPGLSPDRRDEIEVLMPQLVRRRTSWMLAATLPFAFVRLLLERPTKLEAYAGVPVERRGEWDALNRIVIPTAAANSPAAAFVIVIQLMVITFFVSFAVLADVLICMTADGLARGFLGRLSPGSRRAARA